jgi:hypothetical protein
MALAIVCFVVLLVAVAAVAWVRLLVSVYQWLLRCPLLGQRVSLTGSLPGEGGHDGPEHDRPQRQPLSGGTSLSSPPPACFSSGLVPLAVVPFATALEPDFESFFGGMEAAVAAGGIAVIALVVVLAVRKLTSF